MTGDCHKKPFCCCRRCSEQWCGCIYMNQSIKMLKLTIDHLNIAFAEREVNKFYCIKMKMLLGGYQYFPYCYDVLFEPCYHYHTCTHTHTRANCRLLVSYYKGYIDYTYTMSHLAGISVWFVGFLLTITSFLLITPVISPACVCVCVYIHQGV